MKVNRTAKTAIDIFNDILEKETLSRSDLDFIIERIDVFTDRIEITLKANIDALLRLEPHKGLTANFNCDTVNIAQTVTQKSSNKRDKVIRVNVFSKGDPSQNTLIQSEAFAIAVAGAAEGEHT